ncbi:hypothetical protein GQ55_9G291400 [Panicum hallii var. hallii]|uniref:Uncharacterized protein n=1 Tax=Panicum hallii var. hallii TaxID=1504633 RepID=A0A2T7C7N4_9POAL|nr:hypothetical protein GQ55_9G291400 [Panicum hallii var. hallii]
MPSSPRPHRRARRQPPRHIHAVPPPPWGAQVRGRPRHAVPAGHVAAPPRRRLRDVGDQSGSHVEGGGSVPFSSCREAMVWWRPKRPRVEKRPGRTRQQGVAGEGGKAGAMVGRCRQPRRGQELADLRREASAATPRVRSGAVAARGGGGA